MPRAAWFLLLVALLPIACGSNGTGEPVAFVTVDTDPDWSPDGRWIAFASSRNAGGIYLVRTDGTGMRQVFIGGASNVAWSPDSRRIAFEDRGIYVIGAHGGRPTKVLAGREFALPTWSTDGHRLAVVKDEGDISTAIYIVGVNGQGLRRLFMRLRPNADSVRASETEPDWSPDGRRIAFQAGNGHIVLEDVAGGERRELTRGYEPAWSPDGRRIAFQFEGALWVVGAEGSGAPLRLAENGGDPSWAPSSNRLVFEVRHWHGRYWRRPQSLSLVDAGGDNLKRLTYGGSKLDNLGWRGDVPPVP